MPVNAPQTKSSELIDCINALDESGSSDANNFELARIKREAMKLANSDANASYVIQGIIAAFEGNIDEMRRLHDNSIKLCRDGFTLGNYATSLSKTSFDKEALSMAEDAYRIEPGNLKIIDQLIRYNFRCGKVDEALKWYAQWQKEKPGEQKESFEYISSVAAFLNEHEISSDDIEKLVCAAVDVLHENEVFKYDLFNSLFESEGDVLSWILSLRVSVDEVADLTSKFTDKALSLPKQLFALQFIDLRYESNPA